MVKKEDKKYNNEEDRYFSIFTISFTQINKKIVSHLKLFTGSDFITSINSSLLLVYSNIFNLSKLNILSIASYHKLILNFKVNYLSNFLFKKTA